MLKKLFDTLGLLKEYNQIDKVVLEINNVGSYEKSLSFDKLSLNY